MKMSLQCICAEEKLFCQENRRKLADFHLNRYFNMISVVTYKCFLNYSKSRSRADLAERKRINSAFQLSGPSNRDWALFPQHEATNSIANPPGWYASLSQGYLALTQPVSICTPGWRAGKQQLSVLTKNTTECPSQGPNHVIQDHRASHTQKNTKQI